MRKFRLGDLPLYDADESLELMWHHLELAFVFSLNIDSDAETREEFIRLVKTHSDIAAPTQLETLLKCFDAFQELFPEVDNGA